MPMILLVLDHIQINVLNIHNPQGSAGHQIMKSPGSSFSCLWNIYDQGWVELVQMFWVWGLLSIQREFERERSPHPGKWNINLILLFLHRLVLRHEVILKKERFKIVCEAFRCQSTLFKPSISFKQLKITKKPIYLSTHWLHSIRWWHLYLHYI